MAIDFKEQSLSEFLKDRLTEIKSEHRDHLSAGNLKDFAEYTKVLWNNRGHCPCRKGVRPLTG